MARIPVRDLVKIEELLTHDLGTDGDVLFNADLFCQQERLQIVGDSSNFLFLIHPILVAHKEIQDE